MIDFTHEDIERLWNSISHYVPERSKLDAAIDFIKSLDDIGIEHDEIKASGEFDPKTGGSDQHSVRGRGRPRRIIR